MKIGLIINILCCVFLFSNCKVASLKLKKDPETTAKLMEVGEKKEAEHSQSGKSETDQKGEQNLANGAEEKKEEKVVQDDDQDAIDELVAEGGEETVTTEPAEKEVVEGTPETEISESRPEEEIQADIKSHYEFPLVYNDIVEKWIKYFQGKGRSFFLRYLGRSTRFLPIILPIIRKFGLPDDLIYLAMIESGFNEKAFSRAKAVGIWQFMRYTGKRYGLTVDSWVDERRDPIKATYAAASHLRDLFNEFNNWYLAAAAYNAGAGKIKRVIKMYGTDNFWELARKKRTRRNLRNETRNYVPKMIAVALMSKSLEKYGFSKEEIQYEDPLKYDVVQISLPIDLHKTAELISSDFDSLKTLNPELRHNVVPPGVAYRLKLPIGTQAKFIDEFEKIKNEIKAPRFLTHVVKRGETLSLIARSFGVTPDEVKRLNNIQNPRSIRPGRNLIIPAFDVDRKYLAKSPILSRRILNVRKKLKRSSELIHSENTVLNTTSNNNKKLIHIIKPGESIWMVAQKYNVSMNSILKWNGLKRRSRIYPGHELNLYLP